MTRLPRIYADFQKTDDKGRLVLTTLGTKRDLARENITLRQGLELEFYADDDEATQMVVPGVVSKDEKTGRWVAEVDWSELRREPKR